MIIKLILANLELDLSNYEFTLIEENNWLKDNTISKFTYPVEIELTNAQDAALGNISEQNLSEYNTLLDGMFYVLGEEHEAVLEIESITGRNVVAQIRYGLEEFPNFNKRLSELPLEKFDLLVSIYAHAETIISQTWPAVNYNFPQVITDALDTSDEQWQYFEGIINKYLDDAFIENSFDAVENEQLNKNIMLPMPYLLYVLQAGFLDAGFTLAGEILDDTYYKKATIYALNDFYTRFSTESAVFTLNTDEFTSLSGQKGTYNLSIPLPEPGRYKLAGNVILRGWIALNLNPNVPGLGILSYNGVNRWSGQATGNPFAGYVEKFYSIDFNVDYTGTEGDITFASEQLNYSLLNGVADFEAMILDLTLTQIAKFDVDGNLVSTLVEATSIDLSKSVPDMSFGEFVNALMKKRNYGYTITDNVISIDKRQTTNINTSNAIDLTPFEVATPERNFNRGKTFEFKTFEYQSDEYPHQKIFISNSGYVINNYTKNDDTEEITVNALALPLKVFGVKTAHDFLNDNTKLQMVLYSQLTAGLNLAEDPEPISLLNNYLNDYVDWFRFLLTSQNLVWVFESSYERLSDLKIRSIIYAYRQFHIIRKLTRKTYLTEKNGIYLETEIETESLE